MLRRPAFFSDRRDGAGAARRRGGVGLGLLVALMLLGSLPSPVSAASFVDTKFQEELYASGLYWPTAMAFAPDGRLFVTEQIGRLRIIKNLNGTPTLLPTPFLTVPVDTTAERGLLGVAFDPNFQTNNYVYVYYTAKTPTIHNRVSRFTAAGDVALAGSETVLLDMPTLSASHHNGGAMHFGPDGKLYIAVGENKVSTSAQSLGTLLGKVLRLNPDGSIPADNPFYHTTTGINRAIWAYGLRNPFRFSIQPGTGRIFINDVGENQWEEINEGVAGANYGWPVVQGPTTNSAYRSPLYAYGHGRSDTLGCAITGGVFYNPPVAQFPAEYAGDYFFTDFCSGWIRRYDLASKTATIFARGLIYPVDLTVGTDGSLYYLARGSGTTTGVVHRIRYTGVHAPTIATHPDDEQVSDGQTATFSVVATGTPPLRYQWERDNGTGFVPIPGANGAGYSLTATAADNGARFRCIVSNNAGSTASNPATLSVLVGSPPVATIIEPAAGTFYTAGTAITLRGAGSDAEDGVLTDPAAFTWWIDFHHGTGAAAHTHPALPETTGTTIAYTIPDNNETATDVFYRLYLRVRDSDGQTHTTFRDLLPRTTRLTFQTDPPGLKVQLDGLAETTPLVVDSVVGVVRTLDVASPQTLGGVNYEFVNWSDGGAAYHTIVTPADATTYTATFREGASTIGTGAGLRGNYYNNANFTGTLVTRLDPTINFDWGNGAPVAGIAGDTFSVRWTGKVQAQFSEDYTFSIVSDDGVRLWVNGVLLIDAWQAHAVREDVARQPISLVAGEKYDIVVEYYDNWSRATVKLSWQSASTPKQIVPQSQLYAP